jgi:hypothetical protein
VPDQQYPLVVTFRSELGQKLAHALGDLLVTFSVGERGVERCRAHGFHICPRTSCEVAIITFAESSILDNRDRRALKDETGRFIGPLSVGGKNDVKELARVLTPEERPRLLPPGIGQGNITMAGGQSGGVVKGLRVSLNPNVNHQWIGCPPVVTVRRQYN